MGDETTDPLGEDGVDHDRVVTMLAFVADAGKEMLQSSTSVSEVEDRLRQFLTAVGLDNCALDGMMSSLIISYSPQGATPVTVVREVHVGSPRLARLAGADALLDEVESGSVTLEQAVERLRALEDAPPPGLFSSQLAILVSVLGWVLFFNGSDALTIAVALATTVCTFPVGGLVRRLGFPTVASTFLAATVVAAIPNLLAAAGVSLLLGPAIVAALFPFLPGRSFVSSVIDGLANAPLSAISRGVQAVSAAGFLALGMLVGNRIGTGFGLEYEPDATATPLAFSIIGSAVGVFGLAVAWAMPRRQLLPTVATAALGWLIVGVFTDSLATQGDWPVYAIAAGAVGLTGALLAAWQGSSASIYTGVAILPLVPGFTLYSGMLAVAQGDNDAATSALGDAGIVSLAIAIGVALGLGAGRNAVAAAGRVIHSRETG